MDNPEQLVMVKLAQQAMGKLEQLPATNHQAALIVLPPTEQEILQEQPAAEPQGIKALIHEPLEHQEQGLLDQLLATLSRPRNIDPL